MLNKYGAGPWSGDLGERTAGKIGGGDKRRLRISFQSPGPVHCKYRPENLKVNASIGGTCVFSHLDGDIARLIRFREAMQTGAGSFEVLCFDDQAPFLREYLGPYITLKTIDAATVEAELGL